MTVKATRLIAGSALTNGLVTYYTAPVQTSAVIKSATADNTGTTAVLLTVHVVPPAGSTSAATEVISSKSIAGLETYNCPELLNQVLPPGYLLQAKADTGAVVGFSASGVEIN